MIGRRTLLAYAGATLLAPQLAHGQRRVPLIGYLAGGPPPGNFSSVSEALGELGYVDGSTAILAPRWAANQSDLAAELARELVAMAPDVLVAGNSSAATALAAASSTIPIVVVLFGEETAIRLTGNNLGRPARNTTGVLEAPTEIVAKRIEVLHEALPRAARIALIDVQDSVGAAARRSHAEAAAARVGFELVVSPEPQTLEDIPIILQELVQQHRVDAILPSAQFENSWIEHAGRAKVPAIYRDTRQLRRGGLMSYGADPSGNYPLAASYVDRILRGAAPADLPALPITNYELGVNLAAAREQDFAFPQSFLALADVVIE